MSERQKRAAAMICLIVVAAALVMMIVIAAAALTGRLTGNSFPGNALMLLMSDNGLATAMKWVPPVLAVGSSLLASARTRDRLFRIVIASAATAAALALMLLVALKSSHMVHQMCDLANIEILTDPDAYRSAVNWLFGGLAVWLGGVLGTQLGIKPAGEGEKP